MIIKDNKGITIISLVIIIVLILIVSLVTIKIITDNGIIYNAQKCAQLYHSNQKNEHCVLNDIYNQYINKDSNYKKDYLEFDGTNYIDTGIKLFSKENINKDFEIKFDIIDYSSGNMSTMINTKDERKSPWPGFAIRISDGAVNLRTSSTENNTKNLCFPKQEEMRFKLKRISNILYYSLNDGKDIKLIDYSDIENTFDVPLTFGASLDADGKPFRYFTGKLANIEVKLEEDNDSDYSISRTDNSYKLDGKVGFNGKNFINTGLKLFDDNNIDKDFTIEFEIEDIQDNVKWNTILNLMDETGSPWPGFVVRISSDNNDKIAFKANSTSSNRKENLVDKEDIKKVIIKRKNRKLYYTINDNDEVLLIDYSDIEKSFDTQLIFGASLDGKGKAQRFFKGTLSNIKVEIAN